MCTRAWVVHLVLRVLLLHETVLGTGQLGWLRVMCNGPLHPNTMAGLHACVCVHTQG